MEALNRSFLGLVVKRSLILTVVCSVIGVFTGQGSWLAGLWAGFAWIALNSFLIDRLLRMSVAGNEFDRRKVFSICLIKFPVLYLLGFYLLISPHFRVEGLLTGFTLYLVTLISGWFLTQVNKRSEA